MRLRRSQLDRPGIRRVRSGRGFRYLGPDGAAVDKATRERIRALAIPPAWHDVWISPHPNGHIQAVGVDAAGRRQYRYHDAWRARRDAEKFDRVVEFARRLPRLRAQVEADLKRRGLARERVLALGIRLLDLGMFRTGGEEYAEEHDTYGLATLERRHVHVRRGEICFDYQAKGGARRQITIGNGDVVPLIRRLKARRGGGRRLLTWRDGDRWVEVSASDLNQYLKEAIGDEFSAKDFRTWEATLLAAIGCARAGVDADAGSEAVRRRAASSVVKAVAAALGNTPAVCRRAYVHPGVLDRFLGGDAIASTVEAIASPDDLPPRARRAAERAVVRLLADESA